MNPYIRNKSTGTNCYVLDGTSVPPVVYSRPLPNVIEHIEEEEGGVGGTCTTVASPKWST